ncbi:class I SAM-dependent methyltransferase [Psychrobacillus sp. FSL W7-1457]|uniref:class I SAM-dependent methyltransferase n=1 Tax=unclassified Psychrobacillus TaxID=2636677 RepID=UPI0030F4F0ED
MSNKYLDLLSYFGIGSAHPGGFGLTQFILGKEKIQAAQSVLDIGCGTGKTSAFLATTYGCKVTAVDNHPVMIEKARERFKPLEADIHLIEGDITCLPLESDSFDIIISESVLVFTDIALALSEAARLLKKDGKLLLIEMTGASNASEEVKHKVLELYGIQQLIDEEEWKEILKKAGFSHIEILENPADMNPVEIEDMNPSSYIDMTLYDVWDEHNQFLTDFGNMIGYRIFKCQL